MLVAWLSLSCGLSRTAASTTLQALLLIFRILLTPFLVSAIGQSMPGLTPSIDPVVRSRSKALD